MYIKQIDIGQYRHLRNVSMGPFLTPGESSDLVVLAGPNAGGKTSILELISLAISNAWSLTYQMNRSQPQSSFEVQLGLFPHEIKLIKQQKVTTDTESKVLDFISDNGYYYRGFNYPDGEYEHDQPMHNAIHGLVSRVLRQECKKPLGFYLGSDRVYLKENFRDNNHLFQYMNYMSYENVWKYAFQTSGAQYKDMFYFLVTWRYNFIRRLGEYYNRKEEDVNFDEEKPIDEYGNILKKVFPEYSFTGKKESAPTDLFIRIPSGDVIPFSDLSSGEKEVFFTLCFFQRHNVEDAVIVIDEPEIHLHPSLARLLIRTMQDIKPRNQIWLATHNSEVLDEAGRDHVWFIKRSENNKLAEVIQSTNEAEVLQSLRDFFGYYGYIGLARKMIFLEGRNASADRKMFGHLFPQYSRDLKFIPANGCSEVERISSAVLALLEANLGYCEFYLIRDRDYMTDESVSIHKARYKDKIIVLDRHEIENYLIDFEIIAKVQENIFSKPTTPQQVSKDFVNISKRIAGQVLRDMITYRLNYGNRPQYFSVGKMYQNEAFMGSDGNWNEETFKNLSNSLNTKFTESSKRIVTVINETNFDDVFNSCKKEILNSLGNNGWISLFPGKELLNEYAKLHSLGKPPTFINCLIKELSIQNDKIPSELRDSVQDMFNEE